MSEHEERGPEYWRRLGREAARARMSPFERWMLDRPGWFVAAVGISIGALYLLGAMAFFSVCGC